MCIRDRFLADIEIYVDGIATMQIQNLNALVDTVRHEIIERYRPGEDDPHLKVLQAAHISDDEYFSHMVRDDLNLIIRDIREAHKKDSESAPQTTVADELKENLEAVENFKIFQFFGQVLKLLDCGFLADYYYPFPDWGSFLL